MVLDALNRRSSSVMQSTKASLKRFQAALQRLSSLPQLGAVGRRYKPRRPHSLRRPRHLKPRGNEDSLRFVHSKQRNALRAMLDVAQGLLQPEGVKVRVMWRRVQIQ